METTDFGLGTADRGLIRPANRCLLAQCRALKVRAIKKQDAEGLVQRWLYRHECAMNLRRAAWRDYMDDRTTGLGAFYDWVRYREECRTIREFIRALAPKPKAA